MSARILIIAAAISLSACSSVPKPGSVIGKSASASTSLSARTLAAGECGLFVWTAGTKREFILFSQSNPPRAIWLSSTGETALAVKERSGSPSQGQYPKQSFMSQVNGALTLDLRSAQAIENGTRYQAGTLTQKGTDGWERVTPVVGLSACQSSAG